MKSLFSKLAVFALIIGLMPALYTYAKPDENIKNITISVCKNYKSAKFTLPFDSYDDYSVLITSPEGKEHKGTLASSNVVDDVEIGQWEVVISSASSEDDNKPKGEFPKETDETKTKKISPVKVKIEGSLENIPEEITIPWIKIIICTALVGLILIYAFEVIKRNKKSETEKYNKQIKEDNEFSEYDDIDISQFSQKEKKSLIKGPHIIWDILSFAVPLIAAYIILSYVIMVSVVQSGSMEPKLPTGNTVFYNRLAYANTEPQRGDVVVFWSQEFGSYFGKRIIGIPGDVIQF